MKNNALIIILVLIVVILIGVSIGYHTVNKTDVACQSLGGYVEKLGSGSQSVELCLFDDGTFCAFELIEEGRCVPGEYEYPGTVGDALYPEEEI